ncbi:hypothetical protein EDC44_10449 [Cricetibacter osteomyelitidis]|uniref:Uncharacterized protein n=2 Tax=Cricetibacter osteomyelitidis TaxID=1521931 RepID=A0A4R2T570_9PAST|nr:hypothetical protein EDC44_10449 [Cricetibacter osteomyelitidis]
MTHAVFYNFCEYSIELRSNNVSEWEYEHIEKKYRKIIEPKSSRFASAVASDDSETENARNNQYFVKEGDNMKKYFYIDKYARQRTNFIACPENAKPTGDGNWIRAK